MRILVVEDEKEISQNIAVYFTKKKFVVDQAYSLKEAEVCVSDIDYDAVILDVMLPDGEGFSLINHIRKSSKKTPVLILTARGKIYDKEKGFTKGADDYVVKPFLLKELFLRVQALIKRATQQVSREVLKIDDLEINTNTCQVKRAGEKIQLSPKEYALLEYLAYHVCRVQTRLELLEHVWGERVDEFSNTVDVHIRYLRKKIDEGRNVQLIKTVQGKGYMLCPS